MENRTPGKLTDHHHGVSRSFDDPVVVQMHVMIKTPMGRSESDRSLSFLRVSRYLLYGSFMSITTLQLNVRANGTANPDERHGFNDDTRSPSLTPTEQIEVIHFPVLFKNAHSKNTVQMNAFAQHPQEHGCFTELQTHNDKATHPIG